MRRSAGEGHRSREGRFYRWELRIDGRRIVRKSSSKAGLDKKIAKVLGDLRKGGLLHSDVSTLLFGETYQFYLENEIRPRCSPRTYESYESTYRIHLSKLDNVRLSKVSAGAIQSIVDKLLANGKARTAEYVVLLVSRFYNWCVRRDLVALNPSANVRKGPTARPSTRILTPEQAHHIFGEARRRFECGVFRCYPVLLFCLNTGLRVSEALALNSGDIKEERGLHIVSVEKQLLYKGEDWHFRDVKCRSARTIALNTDALTAVSLSSSDADEDQAACPMDYMDHNLLFPSETGVPMRSCVPNRAFSRLQASLGIDDPFTVHELRHTYLSLLARTCPLQVVMKVAGHSSLRTTERYLKVLDCDVLTATATSLLS